jgi:hypothetical protein
LYCVILLLDHHPGRDVHGHELLEEQLGGVGQLHLQIKIALRTRKLPVNLAKTRCKVTQSISFLVFGKSFQGNTIRHDAFLKGRKVIFVMKHFNYYIVFVELLSDFSPKSRKPMRPTSTSFLSFEKSLN